MLGAALAVALLTIAGLVHQDRPDKAATGARLAMGGQLPAPGGSAGIHTIKHVVVIMQENRSFDSYFGTFPGADGIPMKNGRPAVCVPDPLVHRCVRPFHDPHDRNVGGPHGPLNAIHDIDGGKMDGFIVRRAGPHQALPRTGPDPWLHGGHGRADVMGYHDAREIPNYWAYAHHYVLQDHMFEPNASWSLPAHLFMVSGWSAKCTIHESVELQERSAAARPDARLRPHAASAPLRMDRPHVPDAPRRRELAVLHHQGHEPDCATGRVTANRSSRTRPRRVSGTRSRLRDVNQDDQLGNITALDDYERAAKTGTLPAVSWVEPD